MKALLKKLNTPNSPSAVINFMVEFGPLLEHVTANIHRNNEVMVKLKPKEDVQSK